MSPHTSLGRGLWGLFYWAGRMLLALSAILAMLPHPADEVLVYDALIYNEVYNRDCTEITFRQVGGLDLVDGDYHWMWWRIIKHDSRIPAHNGRRYETSWYDGEHKRRYRVASDVLLWKVTINDPEVDDRKVYSQSDRRGLKPRAR